MYKRIVVVLFVVLLILSCSKSRDGVYVSISSCSKDGNSGVTIVFEKYEGGKFVDSTMGDCFVDSDLGLGLTSGYEGRTAIYAVMFKSWEKLGWIKKVSDKPLEWRLTKVGEDRLIHGGATRIDNMFETTSKMLEVIK